MSQVASDQHIGQVSFSFAIQQLRRDEKHYTGRGYVSMPFKPEEFVRTPLEFAWAFVRGMLESSGWYECEVTLDGSNTTHVKLIDVTVTEHGIFRLSVDKVWIELLTHTLGAEPHKRRSQHGTRNAFCASVGSKDHREFMNMVRSEYAVAGHYINNGESQYFHATKEGCELIGLSKAATRRALETGSIELAKAERC